MKNVPIQSLIDHIKTAIDVDPWAKEMAEELLKKQEPVRPVLARIGAFAAINDYTCPVCGTDLYHHQKYCDECGSEVKWDDET